MVGNELKQQGVYEVKKLVATIALLCVSSTVLAHDIYTGLRDREGQSMLWRTGLYAGGGFSAAEW
jgi:hypothetical protein